MAEQMFTSAELSLLHSALLEMAAAVRQAREAIPNRYATIPIRCHVDGHLQEIEALTQKVNCARDF